MGAHRVRRLLRCAHIALVLIKILVDVEMATYGLLFVHHVRSARLVSTTLITAVFVELLITDLAPQAKFLCYGRANPLKKAAGRLVQQHKIDLDHQPSRERMTIMTTDTSATMRNEAPHAIE